MAVSRYWGKDPNWYNTLDVDNKRIVLADYLLAHETEEQSKERKNRHQRRIIERARQNHRMRYGTKNQS